MNNWLTSVWNIIQGEFRLAVILLVFYFIYYAVYSVKKPVLRCGENGFGVFIRKHCSAIHDRVWIAPWCANGTLHTVACYYIREFLPHINYTTREMLCLSDGQIVALDWLEATQSATSTRNIPTIIVLPGLNGDSQINYVKPWVIQAQELGYRCVVFNFRGKGGVKLSTPKIISPIDTKDFKEVVLHIKKRHPNSPLISVGTSFGAMILGHYVSSSGNDSLLEAAILVSSLFDVGSNIKEMENHPYNTFFSKYLTNSLIEELKQYVNLYKDSTLNMEEVLKCNSLHEFHCRFLLPLYGFSDFEEYHQVASLTNKLKHSKTPVLAICAEDDPFQMGKSLPTCADIEGAPVAIAISAKGGHLGFQEGFNILKSSWADRLFSQFCKAIIEYKDWKTVNEISSNT